MTVGPVAGAGPGGRRGARRPVHDHHVVAVDHLGRDAGTPGARSAAGLSAAVTDAIGVYSM